MSARRRCLALADADAAHGRITDALISVLIMLAIRKGKL